MAAEPPFSHPHDASRWQRVNDVFHRAILLPETTRPGFIATECGDDATLRQEIESLIAAHEPRTMNNAASRIIAGTRIGDYEVTGFLAAGWARCTVRATRS